MSRGAWLAAGCGAAAFFGITGGAVLDPRTSGWLLSHPDSASAQLGWQFFRQTPLLQFPFGANPAYGEAIASSVVFTDSIPLAAFAFKPFAGVLPATFQYFGLWVALAFVLQALLGYRLLLRFCPDRVLAVAGSAFFAIAPAFLFRLGGHYALCAHWVVLAALWLYFAPRYSAAGWMLLLATSALVHFYLLAMVAALWALAELWQRRWRREVTTLEAAGSLACGAVVVGAVLWFAGYFTIGGAAAAMPGFGTYRMNLLAPLDANGDWSRVLPDVPGGPGDFEGFGYLGTGMLLLTPLAAYALLARRPRLPAAMLVPLFAVCFVLTLAAISNRVALGSAELLAYPVPELLEPFAGLLRGSGRLFWPVYYVLYLAILVLVFRGFKRRVAIAACGLALALQVLDGGGAMDRLGRRPEWVSPLASPLWEELGSRYRRIAYVLPRNAYDAFLPWAVLAADHGMALNFGYFARLDADRLMAARTALEREIVEDRLRPDTLYVFESAPLWNIASSRERPGDLAGVLDGYRIIAPGFATCGACDLHALGDVKRDQLGGYALGDRIFFGAGASGLRYATAGWSLPEDWGMRSHAPAASIIVKLAQEPQTDLVLTVEARALTGEASVELSVNGRRLDALTFSSRDVESRMVTIPHTVLAASKGMLTIAFGIADARLPGALGLVAVTLRPA